MKSQKNIHKKQFGPAQRVARSLCFKGSKFRPSNLHPNFVTGFTALW